MNKRMQMLIGLFVMTATLYGQQFQLKWETESGSIYADLGSAHGFLTVDTAHVYFHDGNTHQITWTIPKSHQYENPLFFDNYALTSLISPVQDYVGNGVRDLFLEGKPASNDRSTLRLIDPSTGVQLLNFNSAGYSFDPMGLADVDEDGKLELLIDKHQFPYGQLTILVYSTDLSVTSVPNSSLVTPRQFQLQQNYPNPFNPSTTIRYALSTPGPVSIDIYDATGRAIRSFFLKEGSGAHEVLWDGKDNNGKSVSSGAYFYSLNMNGTLLAKKMLLLK